METVADKLKELNIVNLRREVGRAKVELIKKQVAYGKAVKALEKWKRSQE